MRLDPTDGTVTAAGHRIGPATARFELIDAGGEPEHYTNGFSWVRFAELDDAGDVDGPRWFVAVSFDPDDRVHMIQLARGDGPPGDWSTWSEEAELARRDGHDAWLAAALGDAWAAAPAERYDAASKGQARELPWGRVWSDFDTRSGGSSITIRYTAREPVD